MQNQTPSSQTPEAEATTPSERKELKAHMDDCLDEAIEESFPASDPVSMVVDGPKVKRDECCEFRPSDHHPETDRVAHPDRDCETEQNAQEQTGREQASREQTAQEQMAQKNK